MYEKDNALVWFVVVVAVIVILWICKKLPSSHIYLFINLCNAILTMQNGAAEILPQVTGDLFTLIEVRIVLAQVAAGERCCPFEPVPQGDPQLSATA